jgi:hypothetical protein
MRKLDWWPERIIGGLSSYWVYQHLGNLSPAELAENELFQKVRSSPDDAEPLLREFAAAADEEADGGRPARWSFCRDFGATRLLVIDSRCGRILADGRRSMISEEELAWIVERTAGDFDHLLIGTSLPWLLARALHDLEAWNEQLAGGARGRLRARWSEKVRRAADLEHWAAFRESFEELADLVRSIARGERAGRTAPASICILSGDVHHAYAAEAFYDEALTSRVFQLTCSPLHNFVPPAMKATFRIAWSPLARRFTRRLLRLAGPVPEPSLTWRRTCGPFFGNGAASSCSSTRRRPVAPTSCSRWPGSRSRRDAQAGRLSACRSSRPCRARRSREPRSASRG